MANRGRPRSERAARVRVVCVKLRLYPGEDDDLLAFFESVPPRLRAAMVKAGLRSGAVHASASESISADAVYDALDALVG